jgi:hypothetical protein
MYNFPFSNSFVLVGQAGEGRGFLDGKAKKAFAVD